MAEVFISSVAQWKRAGPITQRSVDRNHSLLGSFALSEETHMSHRVHRLAGNGICMGCALTIVSLHSLVASLCASLSHSEAPSQRRVSGHFLIMKTDSQ